MTLREPARTVGVLTVFALLFAALTIHSYRQESATWDEPQFLTAGYLDWHRDHRVVPEHVPLLPTWAALPLLGLKDIRVPTSLLPTVINDDWLYDREYQFTHYFFYQLNDADRLLYRGRFMMVLLGIGLGVLLFRWARELYGFGTAIATLVLYLSEPNLLAHTRLVTTDFGVALFICGALYCLWHATRRLTTGHVVGCALFFALAQASKSTALFLGPIVLLLVLVRAFQSPAWEWHLRRDGALLSVRHKLAAALGLVGVLAVASYVVIWTVYGFQYLPAPPPVKPLDASQSVLAAAHPTRLLGPLVALDRTHLLPNLVTQGLLQNALNGQQRGAFLAGQFSTTGWWYYFPVVFLIKTPIAILLLFFGGVVFYVRDRQRWLRDELFLLLPIGVYLGTAMTSHLNIGLRHILPIYPFVLLVAGKGVTELCRRVRPALTWILVGLAAAETALVYPHYLAFFNGLVGGPRNGANYLVDSNLDWGQDLKGLKRWMDAHHVKHINLSYFGTADPSYYGIACTYLPGSPSFAEDQVRSPILPGYVAVSATNLRGVYLSEATRQSYATLRQRKPVAVIGWSIYVYWLGPD